jgi:hypothetical protein
MSVEKLVEHFSTLEDPRCAGKVEHRLIDILVIAVCAVIACAESTAQRMGMLTGTVRAIILAQGSVPEKIEPLSF